ncbi:MAG: Flp pilus assembly protein CpaB [Thermoguttaceae bacterium]
MKGKSLALLVLALGCGLVASLGITQVLAKRGDTAAPTDTTPVCVAKTDIASGAVMNADNTKMEQWPKDRVPSGALTRQDDLDGRRPRQKIYAGEPIIEPKLLARGQAGTEGLVPKGLRVVPVQVTTEAIHSGLVLPGARCDVQVFIKGATKEGFCTGICRTILQDIRVFAVNDITSTESVDPKTPDTKSIPAGKTVSLLVTPAQAQIVALAGEMGRIRLILRSPDDSGQPKTTVITSDDLLCDTGFGFGGGDRAKEDPAAANEKRFQEWAEKVKQMLRENAKANPPTRPRASEEQRFTMRVRTGAEVNDVLLINNSGVQGMPGEEGAWTATGMVPSVHNRANMDAHSPTKPVEAGLPTSAAGPTMPKPAVETLVPPSQPGSSRSPGG